MKTFDFHSELWLPRPRDEVFAFFADAGNLEAITPPWLTFHVESDRSLPMEPGRLIDYRLRVHGLPMRWQSEITVWEPPHRFIDEQRRGPYRQWIHEHRFEEKEGGTQTSDHVVYAVPGGTLINRWFVRRDVERIFAFRREKLLELFGRTK